ncbi:aspartate aminotransferase family protein [Leucobacter sp. wl10]|uniref:aminotransferase class III-fold pyridoxal phosphate-dependent enzyme n=1 Tax=Leucobacter sp. wl10 TaxID=2304677 RepID=UPI000E5A3D29|nr:aspartate aminotransferase family protein [Leucobacter sp. wl10]RGE23116.1 aspartate aminotransferase family protein [Leucobacter sp. wl10]
MTGESPLLVRDGRVIAGNQKLRFFPASVVSGRGSEVVDDAGRRLLDLSASWGANSVGHAHPRVVRAVQTAVSEGAGASVLSATNPHAVALAEALLERVAGAEDRRVLLGHSGTDANNAALAAARAATGRRRVLAFHGGYHGGFGAAQSVSGVFVDGGLPGDPDSALLDYPAASGDRMREAADLDRVFAELDSELASGDVAAVIVESHQSDGGLVVPPRGFLRGLDDRARAAGALLICDEVKIGLGRTGLLHGFQHEGTEPDIVTFGKALGGGLPLSAVVGPAAVLDAAPASTLLTTAGNAVSAASGLAVLETIEAEGLVEAAAQRGAQIRRLIAEVADRTPEIFDVRGRGLSLGVELRVDPGSRADGGAGPIERAAGFAKRTVYRLWQLGAVCYLVRGNVLELTPPLNLTPEEAQRAIEMLATAIHDVRAGAVSDAEIAPYRGW